MTAKKVVNKRTDVDEEVLLEVLKALKAAGAEPREFVIDRDKQWSSRVRIRLTADRSICMEPRENRIHSYGGYERTYKPTRLHVAGPWRTHRGTKRLSAYYALKDGTITTKKAAKILAVVRRHAEELGKERHVASERERFEERCRAMSVEAVATLVRAGYADVGHGVAVSIGGVEFDVEARDVDESVSVRTVSLRTQYGERIEVNGILLVNVVEAARQIEQFLRGVKPLRAVVP